MAISLSHVSKPKGLELYEEHVNAQWAKLLRVLRMDVEYARCLGAELETRDGRRILDFISGYCVHNIGHNHPWVVAALKEELDRLGPAMLQSHVSEIAGELSSRLCRSAGGNIKRVYFANSGSEGVDTAIKFARAKTGRPGILYAEGGFHGLTTGSLALMSNPFWTDGFGPFMPGTEAVPWGDLHALKTKLASLKFAAFIVEPIQAESGVRSPEPRYLKDAKELCRRHGALLVLDEVQTGLCRTGPFLAAHRFDVEPDIAVLAKALSGGLIPVAAVLMTDEVSGAVFSSLSRAFVHSSTFGENSLAMRVGLATLDVLERENLGARAEASGERLRARLKERLSKFEMFEETRGAGQLTAVRFKAPRSLALRAAFGSLSRVHPGLFGQILVMRLFRDHGILCQICANDFMALKIAPPLVATDEHIGRFVDGLASVMELAHSSPAFWSEALGLVRRMAV